MMQLLTNPWAWAVLVGGMFYGCAFVGLWLARKAPEEITAENNPTLWP